MAKWIVKYNNPATGKTMTLKEETDNGREIVMVLDSRFQADIICAGLVDIDYTAWVEQK